MQHLLQHHMLQPLLLRDLVFRPSPCQVYNRMERMSPRQARPVLQAILH